MARDITKLIIKIDDEAGWTSLMEMSDTKLVVVDIHSDWCGPCEAMFPTFARIFLDYDSADERIVIATVSSGKMGHIVQESLPHDGHHNLDKQGCYPLFALYRVRNIVFLSCMLLILCMLHIFLV